MAFAYPSFEEIMFTEGEELFRVRRAFRSIVSHMIWFLITCAVVIAAVYFLTDENGPIYSWFSPRWLAVIPAVVLLEIFRKYHDDLYIFERNGVIHYEGRLSLNSSTPALKYIDILGISIEQDVWGRIFDYGDVLLDTAADTKVELTVSGVRSPGELGKLLERLLAESMAQGGVTRAPN